MMTIHLYLYEVYNHIDLTEVTIQSNLYSYSLSKFDLNWSFLIFDTIPIGIFLFCPISDKPMHLKMLEEDLSPPTYIETYKLEIYIYIYKIIGISIYYSLTIIYHKVIITLTGNWNHSVHNKMPLIKFGTQHI